MANFKHNLYTTVRIRDDTIHITYMCTYIFVLYKIRDPLLEIGAVIYGLYMKSTHNNIILPFSNFLCGFIFNIYL